MVIRGGQVSRLTVSEAIKGLEDAWYRDTDIVNEGDENFTRKIKTMMVLGKTKRTEMYVLEDCIRAIELLCDTQIRALFKIHNKNQFVVTFGKNVNSHVMGTSEILSVCKEGNINMFKLRKRGIGRHVTMLESKTMIIVNTCTITGLTQTLRTCRPSPPPLRNVRNFIKCAECAE